MKLPLSLSQDDAIDNVRCRVRSYLASSRNHGLRPIDAIHAALDGHPWLPIPVSA